jgi:hypothetical protein
VTVAGISLGGRSGQPDPASCCWHGRSTTVRGNNGDVLRWQVDDLHVVAHHPHPLVPVHADQAAVAWSWSILPQGAFGG